VPAPDEHVQTQLIDTNPDASGTHDDAPLQPGATFTDVEHDIAIHARATGGGTIGVDVTMPVLVDDVPPSAVGFLDASGDTNAVNLYWAAASDDESVDHYDVTRDGATIGSTAGLSFVDTATTALVSATYGVVAVDPTGNRGPAVSRPVTVRDVTAPAVVASLAASATLTGVSLSWPAAVDNRGVTAYWVKRDGVFVASPSGLSFSERPSAGRHRYTVEAVDAAANHGAAATAEITMPAPAPTETKGPAGTSTTATTPPTPGAAPEGASVRGAVIKVASRRVRRMAHGRRRITMTFTCSRASTMRVYVGSRRVGLRRASQVPATFTLTRGQSRALRVRADFADGVVTRRLVVR
jgi:hypothetical protein